MDPKLQNLIQQLQDENCPPAVLDRVAQRIASEKTRQQRAFRPGFAWAVSVICVVGLVALYEWQTHRAATLLVAQQKAKRALVAQQTQQAFGYIGQALIRAATQTQNALLKEAMPPMRDGFETVKNKVTNPI
jgi:hypothetical protein